MGELLKKANEKIAQKVMIGPARPRSSMSPARKEGAIGFGRKTYLFFPDSLGCYPHKMKSKKSNETKKMFHGALGTSLNLLVIDRLNCLTVRQQQNRSNRFGKMARKSNPHQAKQMECLFWRERGREETLRRERVFFFF